MAVSEGGGPGFVQVTAAASPKLWMTDNPHPAGTARVAPPGGPGRSGGGTSDQGGQVPVPGRSFRK
ncbi:hypothetical protein AB0G05_16780 [Nonomuraea wenchangensis]